MLDEGEITDFVLRGYAVTVDSGTPPPTSLNNLADSSAHRVFIPCGILAMHSCFMLHAFFLLFWLRHTVHSQQCMPFIDGTCVELEVSSLAIDNMWM